MIMIVGNISVYDMRVLDVYKYIHKQPKKYETTGYTFILESFELELLILQKGAQKCDP